jgi:hypothetical protein
VLLPDFRRTANELQKSNSLSHPFRVCFDFSTAAVFYGFLSLFSPCEGGIAAPMASEQGENRGKKNKKEQEWKIQNKLLIIL